MSVSFTKEEIEYIKSQRLARIATASKKGHPDVAPVGFDFDGEYFYVGGHILPRTLKYRNILENPKVSFVIDDLLTVKPWHPRSLKIRGTADLVDHNGYLGPGKYIRIKTRFKKTIGIEKSPWQQFPQESEKVAHSPS